MRGGIDGPPGIGRGMEVRKRVFKLTQDVDNTEGNLPLKVAGQDGSERLFIVDMKVPCFSLNDCISWRHRTSNPQCKAYQLPTRAGRFSHDTNA